MNERDSRQSSDQQPERYSKANNRRTVFWAVGGLYLIYLAYCLLRDYISGAAAETSNATLCLVAGVVFALAGLFLVIVSARQGFAAMREHAQDMARIEAEDRIAEEDRRLEEAEDKDASSDDTDRAE